MKPRRIGMKGLLNERRQTLKMLQTTWASLLRIQITGTDNRGRPQIGLSENHLLPPAPENLEPGTHGIKWPWKVQVGPTWRGLLAPWRRLLEVGGSVVAPLSGAWPTEIVVNTPVFSAKGTRILTPGPLKHLYYSPRVFEPLGSPEGAKRHQSVPVLL